MVHEVKRRTYKERIVRRFVDAEEIDELAVTTARDFACGILNNIFRIAGALLGVERLL